MLTQQDVEVRVHYGLGESCVGRFGHQDIGGLPVRDVIDRVTNSPQPTETAVQTAKVVAKVLRSGRPIDVELSNGADDGTSRGKPIVLDDVVLPERPAGDSVRQPGSVTVRMSEAYKGGEKCYTM